MKKQHKRIISFVTTMALVFGSFSAPSLTYGAQGIDQTSSQASGTQVTLKDIGGHWGEKAIQSAVNAGFVKGYEDKTFKPNRAVTRVEFVSMINKALELRDTNTVNLLFQDVKESAWYYKDIQKASYAKYIKGVSDTSFLPNNNITRQEAASMMASFLPKVGYQDETALSKYADTDNISSWAKPALAVTLNKGYLTGRNNGEMSPKQSLTRAEAAKIIGLVLEKETIVIEDISLTKANDSLKNKIFVGDVTIEKSVGEGDVLLENLTALSKITVLGGGVNTVTMKNAKIIRMIVAKEDTKVRVLATGDTNIFESYVFNDNMVVDSQGKTAIPGNGGYDSMVYVAGKVTAEKAKSIVNQFAEKMDNRGKIISEQIGNVSAGSTISVDNDGRVLVSYPEAVKTPTTGSKNKGGGTSVPTPTPTPEEPVVNDMVVTLTAIGNATTTTCSCGLPLTSTGAFTTMVAFEENGDEITGYAIGNEAQLQHLALDAHLGDTVVLMNDLDFTNITEGAVAGTPMEALQKASESGITYKGYSPVKFAYGKFVPIGSEIESAGPPLYNAYSGNFYGNNKTIKGIIVSGSSIDCVGLFGVISNAVIQDLVLQGGAVSGENSVGGVVGFNWDSTVIACSNFGAVSGKESVGGVAGFNMSSTVIACSNFGAVSGKKLVGGVIGMGYPSIVINCFNTGDVYGTTQVGGVAGNLYGNGSNSIVRDSFNTGVVTGTDKVGGVLGSFEYSTAANCFNTGAVFGTNQVGGVVGYGKGSTAMTNCFNTGAVFGTAGSTGGVVGSLGYDSNDKNEVKDCHWLQSTNLSSNSDLSIGASLGAITVSGITTFSAQETPTLFAIYASMSAIASTAGAVGYPGNGAGGIANMIFKINGQPLNPLDILPNTFKPLQGSYIATNGSLTLSIVRVDSNTTLTVNTGTSLGVLLTGGGISVAPVTPGSNEYNFSSPTSGTWILIKVENTTNPKLNRVYTIYYRGQIQDI